MAYIFHIHQHFRKHKFKHSHVHTPKAQQKDGSIQMVREGNWLDYSSLICLVLCLMLCSPLLHLWYLRIPHLTHPRVIALVNTTALTHYVSSQLNTHPASNGCVHTRWSRELFFGLEFCCRSANSNTLFLLPPTATQDEDCAVYSVILRMSLGLV